jgi:hypothetical protein
MPNNPSQACGPWGPLPGLDPVQEYRVLAHDLQESFPAAPAWHLDRMVVQEMALYGGHSVAVITQAMLQASLHLANSQQDNARDYIKRTICEVMQQEITDNTGLGWGV